MQSRNIYSMSEEQKKNNFRNKTYLNEHDNTKNITIHNKNEKMLRLIETEINENKLDKKEIKEGNGQIYHIEIFWEGKKKRFILKRSDEKESSDYEKNILQKIREKKLSENIVGYYGLVNYKTEENINIKYIVLQELKISLNWMLEKDLLRGNDQFIKIILFQLVCAFHLLHSLGIVHRDLSPSNIMFDKNGRLKIIDFGNSFDIFGNPERTGKTSLNGTESYMCPEYLSDKEVEFDRNSIKKPDIFSIGLIAFHCYFGKRFYTKGINKVDALKNLNYQLDHFLQQRGSPQLGNNHLFLDFLFRCLQKNLNYRADIEELFHHPYFENSFNLIYNNRFQKNIRDEFKKLYDIGLKKEVQQENKERERFLT